MQKLAEEVNMPYVSVTLDVGAAVSACKLCWNYPERFKNVLIHLGDFHFLKENFNVIGKIVEGSGFDDTAFQVGVCSSGSLNGILSGSHYNQLWLVHSTFSDALERLLYDRFVKEYKLNIPDLIQLVANDPNSDHGDIVTEVKSHIDEYKEFQQRIRNEEFGKTPMFWLCLYLDLMHVQHLAHLSIQENKFEVRLKCWQYFMPFYFALNKTNCSHYGSHYVNLLENIEQIYPGLKELLRYKGLFVQAQDRYKLRTATDQRGEQSINRDAKTTGGIKSFAVDNTSVLKWTLNHSEQAKNMTELLSMAGIQSASDIYKPLRLSQILKSEVMVTNVVNVLSSEYINPFDSGLDKDYLVSLSSGVPLQDREAVERILSLRKVGEESYNDFKRDRLSKKKIKFPHLIKRNELSLFSNTNKSIEIKTSTKTKVVEFNRNIVGTLLAYSARNEKMIDFEKALEYPLCSIPLSLANPDGSPRSTTKSKLLEIITQKCELPLHHPRKIQPPKDSVRAFVVDFMAIVRTMTKIPDTCEDLAWKLVKMLPLGYSRIDIVCDTYQEKSLKLYERNKHGVSSKIIVRSHKSKIPRDFKGFLKNGDNKTRLTELVQEVLSINKTKVLDMLRTKEIFFSTFNNCKRITADSISTEDRLVSNQEEADTKVLLHCLHSLTCNQEKNVIVRSPSGDVDITVIMTSKLLNNADRVFLDYGTGIHRKGMWLSDVDMPEPGKKMLDRLPCVHW